MINKLSASLFPLLMLWGCFQSEPNPLLTAPPEASQDICKIPQGPLPLNSVESNFSTGFPFNIENVNPIGDMSLLVLPVDWSNYPGSLENLQNEFEHVNTFINAYLQMSEGRMEVNATFLGDGTRWFRLPNPIQDYPQQWTSDFNSKLAQDAIDTVDSFVDFNQFDVMVMVFPDNPPIPVTKHQEYGFASIQHFNRGGSPSDPRNVFSDEGWVRNYVGGAGFFDDPQRPVWSYYVHEIGHMLSLPDWYMREANLGADYVGGLAYDIGPMSTWDAMSTQDGPSRTFSAWTRWLMGWLDDDRVVCYDANELRGNAPFDVRLVPLDIYEPGNKAIIIRTGEYTGLVIESRRPVFPDQDLFHWVKVGRAPRGLLVYSVDTRKGNNSGTLRVLPPHGQGAVKLFVTTRLNGMLIDGLYNFGASGEADGIGFELIFSGDTDIVRITP